MELLRVSLNPGVTTERLIGALGLSPRAGALRRSFSGAGAPSHTRLGRAGLASPLGSSCGSVAGSLSAGWAHPTSSPLPTWGRPLARTFSAAAPLSALPRSSLPHGVDMFSFGPESPPEACAQRGLAASCRRGVGRWAVACNVFGARQGSNPAHGAGLRRWLSTHSGKEEGTLSPGQESKESMAGGAGAGEPKPDAPVAGGGAPSSPSSPPPGDRYLTVPNAMSLLRLAAAPYIGSLILAGDYSGAIGVMAGASVLDFLDGWVARTFNQTSVIGSFLDPLADKVLVTVAATTLAMQGILSPWLVGTMLTRDALLIAGVVAYRLRTKAPGAPFWSTSRSDDLQVRPSTLSKVNTALQLGLIVASITGAAYAFPPLDSLAMEVASHTVLATTVASFVGYLIKNPLAARR